jgi:tetratricopeptide (TPR) repeat protein
MKPHAFVAMPFGQKKDADGQTIDFNRIHDELLRPALLKAGCEVFRADEEQRAGSIHKDMFQELLVADLVLAELTIDNPNVWYELGVRHALRASGVVLVQARGLRDKPVFDTSGERKLSYRLKDGAPDPEFLAQDIAAIAEMARQTLAASARRKVSPVYDRLPHLREPEWRTLLMDDDNEFGAAYEVWRGRLEVARQKQLAGDVLVLADETPTRALWLEAKCSAGHCLLSLQQFALALEQFEAALAYAPDDFKARSQRIVCLDRLGRHEEARVAARQLTDDHPASAGAWSLAGRVAKHRWLARWRTPGLPATSWRDAASAEIESLQEAIAPYRKAFLADPAACYPGINTLTLHMLLRHLGGSVSDTLVDNLTGGVLWASLAAQERTPEDFWARVSFAELCLLVNPIDTVRREFRNAVAAVDGDVFALESTRQTLQMLRELEFRPDETAAALQVLEAELARLAQRAPMRRAPRQVLLFSGHMVDAPTRATPRFPKEKVPAADAAIQAALDKLGAGPEDLALTQGAAGGDLLFVEACQARGVPVQLLLPLTEPQFVEASLQRSADGADWTERYYAAKARLPEPPRVMPDELGPTAEGLSPFERCNLWLLYTALTHGPDKARLVCLWDGGGGDGPGGTRHMVDEVKRRTGRVHWIDARTL